MTRGKIASMFTLCGAVALAGCGSTGSPAAVTVTSTVISTPAAPEIAPAPAATMDANFIGVLRNEGIAVGDPDMLILAAKTMCFSLRAGQPDASVITDVANELGMTPNQAAFFYGAGTYGYCPDQNPNSGR